MLCRIGRVFRRMLMAFRRILMGFCVLSFPRASGGISKLFIRISSVFCRIPMVCRVLRRIPRVFGTVYGIRCVV